MNDLSEGGVMVEGNENAWERLLGIWCLQVLDSFGSFTPKCLQSGGANELRPVTFMRFFVRPPAEVSI